MKFGIITLVSDNYGNKFQNYAVEQLLKKHGDVETFSVEKVTKSLASIEKKSLISKFSPKYIKQFLNSRLMSRFDLNNTEHSVFYRLCYALINKNNLINLKKERSFAFKKYQDEYLNVSKRVITRENCFEEAWLNQYDCFFCGSDQIWNPTYATTSELAFLTFAKGKSVAIAPSFGLSSVPNYAVADFKKWLNQISILSVREVAGQKIINDLTGRKADVLLDPTMALDVEKWKSCVKKPDIKLPKKYLLCYFLGQVNKSYKKSIVDFAKQNNLEIVRLFDIESPQYYTFDPNEVLYSILNAEYVMTDSFHGTVFSILFKKNFFVFDRNEGGHSMSSRLDTLLSTFGLLDRKYGVNVNDITPSQWENIEKIIYKEKQHTEEYIKNAIDYIKNTKED